MSNDRYQQRQFFESEVTSKEYIDILQEKFNSVPNSLLSKTSVRHIYVSMEGYEKLNKIFNNKNHGKTNP